MAELTYLHALPSARTESGEEAHSGAIGTLATEPVEGWHWDRRVWVTDDESDSVIAMPANWDPSASGITETYFQSGIGSGHDLELIDIKALMGSGLDNIDLGHSWVPEVMHGYYYKYSEGGYLFSDDSEIRYATWSGVVPGISYVGASGFNEIPISSYPKVGVPITVEQYQWDNTSAEYTTILSLEKKTQFSGIRDDDGVRQDTWDENREIINWDLVDSGLNEFIVAPSGDQPKILLNKQYVELVPGGAEDITNLIGLYHFAAPDPTEDSSGHGHTAIPNYLCIWQPGEGGYYFISPDLPLISEAYTNGWLNFPITELGDSGEISFWFRVRDISFWELRTQPVPAAFFCTYYTNGGGAGEELTVVYIDYPSADMSHMLIVQKSGTGGDEASVSWQEVPCRDTNWHKITVSWDIPSQTLELFVDDRRGGSWIQDAPMTSFFSHIDNKLILAYNGNGFLPGFAGDYDEVKIGTLNHITGPVEFLGYVDSLDSPQFHTVFSPVCSGQLNSIYSYTTASGFITKWTPISTDQEPVPYEVKFDYDLGIAEFGSTSEFRPAIGDTVVANYWKTVKVEYEPDWAKDTVLATETNMNPIYRQNSRGFVYLSLEEDDPTRIELSAVLPIVGGETYGPLYIGNAYAPVIAKVYDSRGQLLEDQQVTFNIITSPTVGSFGTSDASTTAPTNWKGEARVFYRPPRSINEIGEVVPSGDVTISGDTTVFNIQNLVLEGNLENTFLYQIWTDDPVQGVLTSGIAPDATSQIAEHYRRFFEEQEIEGLTKTVEWEDAHRTVWDLIRPQVFGGNSIFGRRKIVAFLDAEAINPHTLETGAVSPITPSGIENMGDGSINVLYDSSENYIPTPSGELWGYYMVAPTDVSLQATVFNHRLNQVITSNEIELQLMVPPYMSGVWILDEINDSHIDEISSYLVNLTASGQHVPLGFRLRSSKVTLAAALDGVTFLDVNPRPGLGHQFEVVCSGVLE